jgi:hypothetical protein
LSGNGSEDETPNELSQNIGGEVYQKIHTENQDEVKHLVDKNKSKLEKLLAQPDIFDCLRRINQGLIKSYDDLQVS